MKRILKIVGFVLALVIGGGASFLGYQMWTLHRAIATADVSGAQTAILGSLAPIVVDYGHPPAATEGKVGLLADYRSNPAKYAEREKLVQTWQNATALINAVKANQARLNLPALSSADIPYVSPEVRLDAWKHHFCLFLDNGSITVVSAGTGPSFPDCQSQRVKLPPQRTESDGRLHFLGSGELVVASRDTPRRN
jgi:hypothetical protein